VLIKNYEKQYNWFRARYPKNPNKIRFTQDEINRYFGNTLNIVKAFVEEKQIQNWIFE
jgi:RNA binding exosome subunit